MRLWNRVVIAGVLGVLIAACGEKDGEKAEKPSGGDKATSAAPAEDPGETLAVVNGAEIGSKAFEQAAARKAPAQGDVLSVEEKKEVLDRLIDEELLYQEALRQGLDKDPKVKKVMVNTLLRQEVYGSIRNSDFTDEQLQAYYDAHKDEFIVPEKVQIKRILIKVTDQRPDDAAKAKAEELRATLAADPTKFKDVATENSEDPYRRRGGDVGFVPKTGKPGLEQEIVDKAFTMQVDQISEVFKTAEGYNIISVSNKRDRVERTYQQMKGSVLRKVKNDKLTEMFESYTAKLREGAKVETKEDKLAAIEIKSVRRASPGMVPGANGIAAPQIGGDEEGGELDVLGADAMGGAPGEEAGGEVE